MAFAIDPIGKLRTARQLRLSLQLIDQINAEQLVTQYACDAAKLALAYDAKAFRICG
jgi:hypothetical protein